MAEGHEARRVAGRRFGLLLALLLLVPAGVSLAADGCGLCGMRLGPYGTTLHRITLADGARKVYCSFSCLSEALGPVTSSAVTSIEVADYGTGAFTDATKATYVEGSDAPPVMSSVSYVAFASPKDASAYVKEHGGTVTTLAGLLAAERRRGADPTPKPASPAPVFTPLPRPGKSVRVNDDLSFTFDFDRRPSMGTVIVRVELFDAKGRPNTSLTILGDADMPSMRGAHSTGNREFKLNRKGVYLLPVDIVMPGGWEVYLTLKKGDEVLFRGSYAFSI